MYRIRKLEMIHVAMAVLYLKEDLHSDTITSRIIDSDLSELGYKGDTPERSVNSSLRTSKKWSCYFVPGTYQAHFSLKDKNEVLKLDEVLLAIFAIQKGQTLRNLELRNTVEFTFCGFSLVAVRNFKDLLHKDNPIISKVIIPQEITTEDIKVEQG